MSLADFGCVDVGEADFVPAAVGVGDADGVAVVHGRYPPPVMRALRCGSGGCAAAAAYGFGSRRGFEPGKDVGRFDKRQGSNEAQGGDFPIGHGAGCWFKIKGGILTDMAGNFGVRQRGGFVFCI